jgi:hypothetical protein
MLKGNTKGKKLRLLPMLFGFSTALMKPRC